MDVTLLGTCFALRAHDPSLLACATEFMCAYAPPDESFERIVDVETYEVDCVPAIGDVVPVHRSKHRYWSFDGCLAGNDPRCVAWPDRGIIVSLPSSGDAVRIGVARGRDLACASEAVFHALRGIGLYLRGAGNLLHGSAIILDGRAVVFVGRVLAGKTTALAELTLRGDAIPLANDRVAITPEAFPIARSWPSYASFCEGTLLRYAELADAAVDYELGVLSLRTQRWPAPLRNAFTADRKRIYPMGWFASASKHLYARTAPLGAIVFCHIDRNIVRAEWRRMDLSDSGTRAAVAETLAANAFDAGEASFLPWHGLPHPSAGPSMDDFVRRAHLADVSIHGLELPADQIESIHDFRRTL